MSGYLINFIVYTAAMIGVIFLAVFVYKRFSYNGVSKSKFLNVEDCINLAPRKNLYVVRAGNERFLIASDTDRTSLISKLDITKTKIEKETRVSSVDDLPSILELQNRRKSAKVFKNIADNI